MPGGSDSAGNDSGRWIRLIRRAVLRTHRPRAAPRSEDHQRVGAHAVLFVTQRARGVEGEAGELADLSRASFRHVATHLHLGAAAGRRVATAAGAMAGVSLGPLAP